MALTCLVACPRRSLQLLRRILAQQVADFAALRLRKQVRTLLSRNERVDPLDVESYYRGLFGALNDLNGVILPYGETVPFEYSATCD